jgi:Holliday junction resolvasome RuvABC endonuclease subunit
MCGNRVSAGVWDLREWDLTGNIGSRMVGLFKHLCYHRDFFGAVTDVAYEDVMWHAGVYAAHMYGGLLAGVEAWCEERGIVPRPVGVTTIKKHATGSGRASKKQMVEAARQREPGIPWTHDSADAYWVLQWARDNDP